MAQPLSITVGSGVPEDQLDPGNYPGSVKAVVARSITVQGEDRDVFEWTFLVDTVNDDGSPGEPIEVTGLTSQMTGPQSKTASYLATLMGAEAVQPGVTFTMNDLVGKRALIKVAHNKGGYAKVEDIGPIPTTVARKTTSRAAAVAAPVAEAEPDGVEGADENPTPEGDDDLPF